MSMRRHLTPNETLFAVAAVVAITVITALGQLSEGGFIGGLSSVLTYAAGKTNGYRQAEAAAEVRRERATAKKRAARRSA